LWFFRLLLLAGIPMVFLILLELILRLAGFGYSTGFFLTTEHDGQQVLLQNNRFGWRFFGPAIARMPVPICIPKTKDPATVRVIVFGESAAQGDPQPRFGLARMLQAMLELRYPGVLFEVVNTGITAIDSNVILPIARDCAADADADIWVIYMGNNEVVGPYGAGTVFGRQTPPLPMIRASLALKSTRTGQLIDHLLGEIHKSSSSAEEWGGMEMFLNQQISRDDERMKTVYDHFRRNLSDIIQAGSKSGAGIVVSTVAVNLKDCAPFASAHRQGLSDADKTKWEDYYRKGVSAQAADDPGEAAGCFLKAAQIDDEFAELRFRQGACALALGQIGEAQKQFSAACDLDTLRFRCDSRLNELIRQTVSDENNHRVVLADAEKAFAAQSPDGLPGDDLFYEHVHPTFHGNYVLALTIAPELESLLPARVSAQVPAGRSWASEADCARRLAWSDWDRQEALVNIYSRLVKPPFTSQLNHVRRMNQLKNDLAQLIPATQPSGIKAAELASKNALITAPDDALLLEHLAVLQESSGDLANAEINAQRAVDLLPGSSEDWSQLGITLAKQLKYDRAATAFRRAFELDPAEVWALQNLAQSLKDSGQTNQALLEYRHALAVNPRFGSAWLGLGQIYETMGQPSQAEDCYRKALLNRVDRPQELATLARFCESRGWHAAAATNFEDAIKLDPSDATLYVSAGQNFDAMGQYAGAEQSYAEAVKLSPDLMTAHFLYGLELGRDGNPDAAAAQFRESVRIMPDLAEARMNLGMALENARNYSEALEQFEKVLEQNPDNTLAQNHARALRQALAQPPSH
jgi:tetratricopeptide (TPR) repeat protein